MRVRRVIRRAGVLLLLTVLIGAGVVYVLASRIPADYRPQHLGQEKQEEWMRKFLKHTLEEDGFADKVGRTRPGESFTWTITAEQANHYLASVDAIASVGRTKRVHAIAQMERAGLVDPAVAMNDGVLTIMGKVRKFDKIVSVGFGFEFNAAGDVAVRIRRVRIGVMPIPQRIVDDHVEQVRLKLAERLGKAEAGERVRFGSADLGDLSKLMRRIVNMLDGAHVRPELTVKLGARHKTLIRRIEITEGKLTLHCHTPEEQPTR